MSDCETKFGWRRAAAKIVEELFPCTSREEWDQLLDLRGLILHGENWNQAIRLFLECRQRLEDDHYLPFYRLRQLLTSSLQLEGACPLSLRQLLTARSSGSDSGLREFTGSQVRIVEVPSGV